MASDAMRKALVNATANKLRDFNSGAASRWTGAEFSSGMAELLQREKALAEVFLRLRSLRSEGRCFKSADTTQKSAKAGRERETGALSIRDPHPLRLVMSVSAMFFLFGPVLIVEVHAASLFALLRMTFEVGLSMSRAA